MSEFWVLIENPVLLALVLIAVTALPLYWFKLSVRRDEEGERRILSEIFDSLGGDEWTNKSGWKVSSDLRDWEGVKLCPISMHVQKIVLPNNNLTGKIPGCIGDLQMLQELDLRDNDIGGRIPGELSRLLMLEGLYLYGNRLSGPIPVEISFLPNLSGIYLYNNNLEGNMILALSRLLLDLTSFLTDRDTSIELFRKKLGDSCFVFM